MRSRRILAALVTLLVASTGCQVPRFEGPQIQQAPQGFTLQPETHPTRRLFPDLEVGFHSAWVRAGTSATSVIYVDEHPVVVDVDDVLAAREAARAAEPDPDAVFGEVEAIRIDGRDAWGWHERIESPRRGLVEVTYSAIVPYESVSYALVFTSGEATLKRAAPDTLRAVLSTFGIGRTTYNIPLIVIALGAVLLFVTVLRARSRARAARLRSINLVTLDKGERDAEALEGDPATSEAPAGGSARPPPSGASPPEGAAPPSASRSDGS